jgi:hypothetical protein
LHIERIGGHGNARADQRDVLEDPQQAWRGEVEQQRREDDAHHRA